MAMLPDQRNVTQSCTATATHARTVKQTRGEHDQGSSVALNQEHRQK